LWLSEGIPYVFKDKPIAFERGREQLAKKLGEHPKHFSLTGSARLGYSLSPYQFSKPFAPTSDLDLFAVSSALFKRLEEDIELFIGRFESGEAKPQTSAEARFWPQNVERLKQTVPKGFANSNYVPIAARYATRQAISDGLTAFNISSTGSPNGGGLYVNISLRVYRDWEAAVSQIGGSLVKALREKGYKIDGRPWAGNQ
jgi:hypothetical protein